MKKIRLLLQIGLFASLLSCSVQSGLNRQFIGKDKTELDNHFGQRGTIVHLGTLQYVEYTKTEQLKSMEISKGVTTLDPMISPAVEKTQKYIFYLDPAGKVTSCKYESEYKK